jgi:hypothetical protein
MSLECWQEVINDYEQLLENGKGYDVIIGADGNEEIRAHSLVLSTRSQYFCTELSKENVEKRDGKIIFKRSDISSKLFKMILRYKIKVVTSLFAFLPLLVLTYSLKCTNIHITRLYFRFIYCGRIDLTTLEGFELIKLSIAVDDLNIRTLFPQIEDYIIKNQSVFLYQNTIEVLETIYQRESFIKLWNFCLEKIYKEPKMLFESDKFVNLKAPLVELIFKREDLNLDEIVEILSNYDKFIKLKEPLAELLFNRNDLNLDKIVMMLFNSADKFINLKAPLLELIIKRDDLILEEIDVWNNLLKWGLSQNPTVSQDSTRWNNEEIKIMERALYRFIPLVRFYYMSPEDFLDKIFPLKELLPKDLLSDLLTFHITPSRRANVNIHPPRQLRMDSVIIQPKHIAIFAGWIDKKEYSHFIPYKFNLLYRAKRDGNTAAAFHAKCDNKGATIVVVKIQNSEHIVGGYNSVFWDSSNLYRPTKDSFIFSFTDRNNFQTAKVGYVKDAQYENAIYCGQNYGPIFGNGHDLLNYNTQSNDTWAMNNQHSYYEIDVPRNYNIYSSYKVFNMENYEVFQVVRK